METWKWVILIGVAIPAYTGMFIIPAFTVLEDHLKRRKQDRG